MEGKNIIECYFDPEGTVAGSKGCYRARLERDHRLHAASQSDDGAVKNLLTTLGTFGIKYTKDEYEVKYMLL